MNVAEIVSMVSLHGAQPAEPVIVLRDVVKAYGRVLALDGLSLAVPAGEILALVGPSGCGKTTTLRIIAGFERPDAGWVLIGGREVSGAQAWVPPERRDVGLVFQDFALFPHLRVAENVAFGLHRLDRVAQRARVDEVLRLTELEELAHRYPHELSGGQQQRVAVARALAPRPGVILLDEPFSNLDRDLRRSVREQVQKILRRAAIGAIFVTHDREEAFALGDRVAVMRRGRIEQVGRPDELLISPATRFVAEFLSDARVLPAEVRDGCAYTELGAWPTGAADGPSEVLLRPEELALRPERGGSARVVARCPAGLDCFYDVELSSGCTVRCRALATRKLDVGEAVAVELLCQRVLAFPRRNGASNGA